MNYANITRNFYELCVKLEGPWSYDTHIPAFHDGIVFRVWKKGGNGFFTTYELELSCLVAYSPEGQKQLVEFVRDIDRKHNNKLARLLRGE